MQAYSAILPRMSWQSDFEASNVWAAAEAVQERLAGAVGEGELAATETGVGQVRDLAARVLAQREDPDITITTRSLGTVANLLTEIHQGLPNLAQAAFKPYRAGNMNKLPRFDQIADEVRSWPQSGKGKLTGLSNQVAALDALSSVALDAVQDRVDRLQAQIESSNSAMEQSAAERDSKISQSVAATQTRLDEVQRELGRLQETAEQQSTRIDEAIRAHQETFSQAEQQRTEQVATVVEERKAEWLALLSTTQEEIKDHLASMDSYEEQSKKVLTAVGVNSTATDYGSYANLQARSANAWRWIAATVLSLAGAWFVASSIFPSLHGNGALWEQAVSRLGITAAIAGVGLYAARESSQHRAQERRARHTQLVLTALEPFIANLEPERAAQIRDEAARALFVADPASGDPNTPSSDQAFTLMQEMVRKFPDQTK